MDRIHEHIQKEHNNDQKVVVLVQLFAAVITTVPQSEPVNPTSTSDVAGPSSGPIRGRVPHLQVRAAPYERSGESSSLSLSPSRRPSLGTLSPLLIPSPLAHLSTPPAVPSPLNQVAYSPPNSPTPPYSDDEMDVDDPQQPVQDSELPLDEEEILTKASIAITSLPHLQTTPTTQLLTCTTCLHGILPSSMISHPTSHNIKLLRDEKQDLQKVVTKSSFLNDSNPIPTPILPCPPIKGLLVQDGFACTLCSFCCPSIRSIQSHFCEKHKDVSGGSKDYYKEVQVQAFFSR